MVISLKTREHHKDADASTINVGRFVGAITNAQLINDTSKIKVAEDIFKISKSSQTEVIEVTKISEDDLIILMTDGAYK